MDKGPRDGKGFSPIEPHSCKHCRRIVLRKKHFLDFANPIKLPHTKSEIREALVDQCMLIRLFASKSAPELFLSCSSCPGCKKAQPRHLNILAMPKLLSVREHVSMTLGRNGASYTCPSFSHNSWREQTHLASPMVIATGVTGEAATEVGELIAHSHNVWVGSKSSLVQMYQWLTECHSSHPLCRQDHDNFVPRRLLHIEPSSTEKDTVRLVEDWQDRQVDWVALSYVWGEGTSLKTTMDSIVDMKAGIEVEKLPPTIQDAIIVCRAMSLDKLWVDSLCIIQDDPNDLTRELASMPQIYQRAWVTISASTAPSVSDGFLQQRCYSHCATPLSLPYLADDGVGTGEIIFVPKNTSCSNQDEPINGRAWTYQERRLSPRVLDFRWNKVVLYCCTGKRCQGDGSRLWTSGTEEPTPEYRLYRPCSGHDNLPQWHAMVDGYVDRKLTFPSDKLTALSALADVYRKRTRYTYVAGLWKESLITDLCWRNVWRMAPIKDKLLPRPTVYRAPSWSWAAIDVPSREQDQDGSRSIYSMKLELESEVYTTAVITNVAIRQWPPGTTYGKVYAGSLTLEAPVLRTTWYYNQLWLDFPSDPPRRVVATRDARETGWYDGDEDASIPVLVVWLARAAQHGKQVSYYGLLLVQASEGIYRRVGLFEDHVTRKKDADSDLVYAYFQTRTITII
ncbi:heterokaryon incompatibility protein-domain-containing protein [Alternaria rosae]|uniref:heterokaryon incompatibility protein-domain-containing protein n=1 Tax=Alternaria rosae TaxID=1187941 RepID=UPI001E8ED768|nr:heterokaryon incompatibility protein-domain-containing protein [Alternaria rosae]KAH6870762.1 heterokaryon incompatibility protein-domain-containing protein [Alternaria rosae]